MATISEQTKIKVYDVINSMPVLVTVILTAGFVWFQTQANTKEIETLKIEKKTEVKEIADELKKVNESLTVIKTTLKIKEQ